MSGFFDAIGSPLGTAGLGVARSFGNNLRRKHWRGWNQENVYQPAGDAIGSYYDSANQLINATYPGIVQGYDQRYANAMGQFYNPGGAAPATFSQPMQQAAPAMTPAPAAVQQPQPSAPSTAQAGGGGPFSKVLRQWLYGGPNEGPGRKAAASASPAPVDKSAARMSDTAPSGSPGAAAVAMPNYGQASVNALKDREGRVLGPLEQSQSDTEKGYWDRYARALKNLEGLGEQSKKDTDERFDASAGTIRQQLVDSGLANTSVLQSMTMGNERERANEQNRLDESIRQQRLGVDLDASGEALKFRENAGNMRALTAQGLTGDTAGEMAAQGREARATSLGASADAMNARLDELAAKLNIGRDQLQSEIGLLFSQLEGVPNYMSPIDALEPAITAHQNQSVADASTGLFGGAGGAAAGGLAGLGLGLGEAAIMGSIDPTYMMMYYLMGSGLGGSIGGGR